MGTTCTACESGITVRDDVYVGEILVCRSCEAELEVTALDPVEVALAPEPDEDWGE